MLSVAEAQGRLGDLMSSEPVRQLSDAFSRAGFELALVGGPVRDAFLGRVVNDLDFATNARPDDIVHTVRPIASAHWDIGRAFGTIGARVAGHQVEITTYRSDSYDGESRKPEVQFGDSLEADLVRRDFTVNALALRVPQRELVDPSGGVSDLVAGVLRTPAAPELSFGDDPLRMLRAARFAAQLGFVIEGDTERALTSMAAAIERISAERVRDELGKLLCTEAPRLGLEVLVDSGLADFVLPELPALRLETDEHHHHKDVYEHSLTVLDQAIALEQSRGNLDSPDLVLRLAALLHDAGKPATRRLEPGGSVSFHHHDVVGAKLVKKRLRALRCDNDTIAAVTRLIELHLRFFGYSENAWSDSAVRRYVRDADDQLERLHILTRADVTTRNRRKAERLEFAYDDLERRIAELSEQEELKAVRPELDGVQIQKVLGIQAGPLVGEAYRFLLELRLDEGPIGSEQATARLLEWWSQRPDSRK
ncbi:MAG TPA: CCA tRNA nucleotidyltransferase [Microbacteriaceae bacterium]|nr:CCA tRNA nucleotidyltransferase [Microbacteriaceae bacterium]